MAASQHVARPEAGERAYEDDEAREREHESAYETEEERQRERDEEEWRLAVSSPEEHARIKQRLPGEDEEEEEEERREGRSDEPRFDAPEQFGIADRIIRERIGGGGPAYAPNFKTSAQEALGLINQDGSYIVPRNSEGAMAAQGITAITEHGPGNVSGRTRAILPLPSDPANSWIVGSVGGGIWKTTNAGASWTLLTQDLASIAVSSMALSASNPNIIYAGTGEGFGNADGFGGEGIFKSTDGGVTWSQLASTTRFNGFAYTNRLTVSPNSPDSVVAATNTGIWRSVDGGTTWSQAYTSGSFRATQVLADPTNWRIQYAAMTNVNSTAQGVIKSTDAGATWTLLTGLAVGTTVRRMELAIAPSLPTTIYAQADISGTSTRHYVSTDAGTTWTAMTGTSSNVLSGQGWYNNTIAVDPANPQHVYVGGLDFYDIVAVGTVKTMIKRTAWNAATTASNYVHADQHNITVVPNGAGYRILNGSDGGVAYSDDGGVTWTKTLTGYNSSQPYGADKRAGADQFITGLQDNGTWVSPTGANAASSWTAVLGGDGFFNLWHRYDPNKLMGAIQYNDFRRSLDGGATWNSSVSGMVDVGSGKGLFVSQLSKSTIEPDLVMAPGNTGIWRSANFGGTWRKATLTGAWYPITSRGYVLSSPVDSRVAWAAGAVSASACTGGCGVMRSTDGGLSFSATTLNGLSGAGSPGFSHFVSGLAVHPTNVNTAYVLFSAAGLPKIMRTTDAGASWASITGTFASPTTAVSTTGFPNVAVYDLLVMPYDDNVMWAATEIGLVVTNDGGATWDRPSFSFPNVGIWSMRIVDDKVVVATHGRGVWTVQMSELATYNPPLGPGLSAATQAPSGNLTLTFVRRAAYDSTRVVADGVVLKRLGANATGMTDETATFNVSVPSTRVDTVQVVSYKDGNAYYSAAQIVTLSPAATPIVTATSDGSSTTPFTITGTFTSSTLTGHPGPSLNTPHNYAANANHVLQYAQPIIVAQSGATIAYDDIALVEPCNDGSAECTSGGFYDYVTVEATKDGANWVTLAKYDARYDATWLTAYGTATPANPPAPALYRTHTIDLLTVPGVAQTAEGGALSQAAAPAFAAGDTILVRWRMGSDGSVNGWGWTIDNIKIQENGVLPVELADFGGVWDGDRVRLSWKTASETNNARFIVERAAGATWQEVGSRPGAGTTATERTYAFEDTRVPFGAERVRYRLHQVDFDGTSTYSGVIEVALGAPNALALHDVSPNPVQGRTTLRYALPNSRPVRIELFDVTGRRVALLADEVQDAGRRELPLDASALAPGTYVVRLTAGSEMQTRTISVMR